MRGRLGGKFLLWLVLGAAATVIQGLAVFWFFEPRGAFLGRAGLQSTFVPLLIEIVVVVLVVKNLDQLHAGSVANPHSLLGQALRRDSTAAPTPPPTRDAWNGAWEDPRQAAEKMRADR